jgi:hypothetical protein
MNRKADADPLTVCCFLLSSHRQSHHTWWQFSHKVAIDRSVQSRHIHFTDNSVFFYITISALPHPIRQPWLQEYSTVLNRMYLPFFFVLPYFFSYLSLKGFSCISYVPFLVSLSQITHHIQNKINYDMAIFLLIIKLSLYKQRSHVDKWNCNSIYQLVD